MPIIKRNSVRFDENAPPTARPNPKGSGRCAPTPGTRLVRADGVVRAIEVTCACGEVTVLELDYTESVPSEKQES